MLISACPYPVDRKYVQFSAIVPCPHAFSTKMFFSYNIFQQDQLDVLQILFQFH